MRPVHAAVALIARPGSWSRRHALPRLQAGRALLVLLALAVLPPAAADDYPTRPVRVIVAFSPGGAVGLQQKNYLIAYPILHAYFTQPEPHNVGPAD